LNRQLMCKLQGPLAIGVCRVGRLLKQGDDGLAGSVHRIAFVPRLPVGRKRDDLLGLDRAFAHRMSPPHDAVISYPCDSRRCRISLPDRKYGVAVAGLPRPLCGHKRMINDCRSPILKNESGPGVRRSAFSPGQALSGPRHLLAYRADSLATTSK